MNQSPLFVGMLLVALLSLLRVIYASLPGVYRVLVRRFYPPPNSQHVQTMLFVVFVMLGIVGVLVNRALSTCRF